jgi:NADP-dependent 3-hydroxy acid dehydrogenase YdfG
MGVLDNQTAFILGASAGIAQASAKLLAADGATLYLLGRSMNAWRQQETTSWKSRPAPKS